MPTIFMTGTSTGLGKAAALLFAEKGWTVIATMRNTAKGADLEKHPNISLMALDVTDNAQIQERHRCLVQQRGLRPGRPLRRLNR